jgi:hypothetical protein
MSTTTQNDLDVTTEWADIVATFPAVAAADTLLQNLGEDDVQVVFGGASAPTGKSGVQLDFRDTLTGNSPHIWVRCSFGSSISVTVL